MKLKLPAMLAAAVLLSSSTPVFAEDPHPGCDGKCPKSHNHPKPALISATPRAEAPALGNRSAAVTVEVWSDFECSFCSRGATVVEKLREKYGDSLRIVFRHMPLPNHAQARLAAVASMAAHEQGRFWEMHDVLFDNQQSLERVSLEKYAKALGLDLERFNKALDSKASDEYVTADALEGQKRGITGTPTFFINGTSIVGAQSLETFTERIDAELKLKR